MKKSILVILLMSTITAANAANCTNHKQGLRWCFEWSYLAIEKERPNMLDTVRYYRDNNLLRAADYVDSACNYVNYSNGVTKEFVTQMAATSLSTAYITRDIERFNRVTNDCSYLIRHHTNDMLNFVNSLQKN